MVRCSIENLKTFTVAEYCNQYKNGGKTGLIHSEEGKSISLRKNLHVNRYLQSFKIALKESESYIPLYSFLKQPHKKIYFR